MNCSAISFPTSTGISFLDSTMTLPRATPCGPSGISRSGSRRTRTMNESLSSAPISRCKPLLQDSGQNHKMAPNAPARPNHSSRVSASTRRRAPYRRRPVPPAWRQHERLRQEKLLRCLAPVSGPQPAVARTVFEVRDACRDLLTTIQEGDGEHGAAPGDQAPGGDRQTNADHSLLLLRG